MSTRRQVLPGIDVLAQSGFAALAKQRVGLVTNHTGLTRNGRATVDVIHEAAGVEVTALFGPEHGIRGDVDAKFEDGSDARTGLPVHSLYGVDYAPSAEQLDKIDTLVFDIQDIGCRFYTYISTLGHVLKAAASSGKRVVVLDRPNPITGGAPEGPVADADKLSFTAFHTMPVRHGMTVGEIAGMLAGELALTIDLEVVTCRGWDRADWYDETGLLWTNPSPNMRSLRAALLYPGPGLLEFTNVSVGRGTDTPFEVFGAPFVKPQEFAAWLGDCDEPGVTFLPVWFTPAASVHAGERCGGVQFQVVDRGAFSPVRVGIALAAGLRKLYPAEWQADKLLTLLANEKAYDDVLTGRSVTETVAAWARPLGEWDALRRQYLLY